MSVAESRLTRTVAYVRGNGLRAGLEVGVNFALPFLIYSYARGGLGDVRALMAAGAPPLLWSIAGFIRERKLDALSLLVLGGIALSLVAFAGGGGVKFLQLRENLMTGLVGLIFLGSAAIGRPLIYQLTLARVRRAAKDRLEAIQALGEDAQFRGAMTRITLVWGLGLMAACAVNCTLVFMLSIKTFLLVSGPITYGVIGLLTLWTSRSVPRAVHQAEARLAG